MPTMCDTVLRIIHIKQLNFKRTYKKGTIIILFLREKSIENSVACQMTSA